MKVVKIVMIFLIFNLFGCSHYKNKYLSNLVYIETNYKATISFRHEPSLCNAIGITLSNHIQPDKKNRYLIHSFKCIIYRNGNIVFEKRNKSPRFDIEILNSLCHSTLSKDSLVFKNIFIHKPHNDTINIVKDFYVLVN